MLVWQVDFPKLCARVDDGFMTWRKPSMILFGGDDPFIELGTAFDFLDNKRTNMKISTAPSRVSDAKEAQCLRGRVAHLQCSCSCSKCVGSGHFFVVICFRWYDTLGYAQRARMLHPHMVWNYATNLELLQLTRTTCTVPPVLQPLVLQCPCCTAAWPHASRGLPRGHP